MTNSNKPVKAGWNMDNSYARLPEAFYKMQKPEAVSHPELVVLNIEVAEELGLDVEALKDEAAVFAGNELPEGSEPLAQAYAGHQFGHFNMLGDGRAVLLGEQLNPKGERFDIQLKGAGRTPYSRGGDGRAALGPMLREYIMSEAMDALGIPTTRSLAVVTTGEGIIRETDLPGAVLTRVAESHLRVGTFQYAANFAEPAELKALADYAIERHYPEVEEDENPYLSLLKAVIKRQAKLAAQWQMVGFIHGVMNTDNVTISGETIDYGPCAFMDAFDPSTVFSSIDRQGRYAYGNQPPITGWNLSRFAESLLPLIHEEQEKSLELAQAAVSEFPELFHAEWLAGMRAKLGLFNAEKQDKELIDILLSKMHEHGADYTNTFAALTFDKPEETELFGKPEFDRWYAIWKERQSRQDESPEQIHELMKNSNPAVIPRNFRVEEALEAAVEKGDYSVMERLLDALLEPYAHSADQAEYAKLPENPEEPYQTFCGT
ncbi:YdiU family protein [Rossellomorea vietnamensis]|uniref:Protein nucleotidyltransferase YdiU n=1 Tax=Rossellomorea vietnamensis TaxID=218284 RepID=A0A5D4NJ64_9BACI|nr:YdiU family protein [Rossellomorea vietnamensis]TYS14097.1 YdiU family protein [Rossellomorea vietnamensis]